MPKFNTVSTLRLNTCHRDLQVIFKHVIDYMNCSILCGFRGEQDQEQAFKEGKSRLHFPKSKHNISPSMAVDVICYPIDWDNFQRHFWFAGYVLGVADRLYAEGKIHHRLRFGGDWDRDFDITDEKGLRDLVHFELMV